MLMGVVVQTMVRGRLRGCRDDPEPAERRPHDDRDRVELRPRRDRRRRQRSPRIASWSTTSMLEIVESEIADKHDRARSRPAGRAASSSAPSRSSAGPCRRSRTSRSARSPSSRSAPSSSFGSPAGHRVGDRGRRSAPAPEPAGDRLVAQAEAARAETAQLPDRARRPRRHPGQPPRSEEGTNRWPHRRLSASSARTTTPRRAGAEGWKELYPYYLTFRDDRREIEEGKFWFADLAHWPRRLQAVRHDHGRVRLPLPRPVQHAPLPRPAGQRRRLPRPQRLQLHEPDRGARGGDRRADAAVPRARRPLLRELADSLLENWHAKMRQRHRRPRGARLPAAARGRARSSGSSRAAAWTTRSSSRELQPR